jgi:hypothetical protein
MQLLLRLSLQQDGLACGLKHIGLAGSLQQLLLSGQHLIRMQVSSNALFCSQHSSYRTCK